MKIEEIIGYYTYRSFVNRPEPADDWDNTIRFGEGELFLHVNDDGVVSGTLAFPAEPASTEKGIMNLTGKVLSWEPLRLHFLGKGLPNQGELSDFEYEYDCTVALTWDFSAPPQRTVLSGTIRRNKDHGLAKAGATASFVAVKRNFAEPRTVPGVALIPEAVNMLASRHHRLRHTVWHTVRTDWFRRDGKMTDSDRDYIKSLGWGIDDPPFNPDGTLNLANGAGEDFLFMHRRMILMVRDVYQTAGKEPPKGWATIPGPVSPQYVYKEADDPSNPGQIIYQYDEMQSGFMVPPATDDFLAQFDEIQRPSFHFMKSSRFFTVLMRTFDRWLRRPNILAQLTLAAYGNLLEMTIHAWMHMRWASVPRDPVSGKVEAREPYDVDTRWDDPKHDYLGDFHSSHVNPIFWNLHGWIDDRIEDWFNAHDAVRPGVIKRATIRGVPWFAQDGTWVLKSNPFDWREIGGGHGHNHGGHGSNVEEEIEVMLKVIERLREVDSRPDTPAALAALPTAVVQSRPLSGFARIIAMTGLDPVDLGDTTI
jgi:hypothetical protein